MTSPTPEERRRWRRQWEEARDDTIAMFGSMGLETDFKLRLLDALEAAEADVQAAAIYIYEFRDMVMRHKDVLPDEAELTMQATDRWLTDYHRRCGQAKLDAIRARYAPDAEGASE